MKRILIIDDEDSMRFTVAKALRAEGYNVSDASRGDDGIKMAKNELPDLVISDVNMPETSGFDVLKALRSAPATSAIPVILMTGASQPQGLRQGMEGGADDYLAKPFVMRDLCATVRARLERREMIEVQAKANEARLLDLLSASQDFIAIADSVDERLMFLNHAGRKMLGLRSDDDITRLILSDFQKDSQKIAVLKEKVATAKRDGVWVGESELVTRQGRSVRVSAQILAHRSLDGKLGYLSIVARDVTELKEAIEEAVKSQRLLRTIIDILPQRVFWKNRAGCYAGANKSFTQDCGTPDLVGKTDDDLPWTPEQTESFRAADQLVIDTGCPKVEIVEKLTLANGKTIWLSTCKVPMRDSEGVITGVLGTYLDITPLKEAEQERQLMEVQLRHSQKIEAIGQLAAGIAHEINTPIQYVGDNIQFLQESFGALKTVLENREHLIRAAKSVVSAGEVVAQAEKISEASDLEYLCTQIPMAISQTLEGIARITKIVRAMKEFSHPGGSEKSSADLNHAIETTITVARNEWKYVADIKTDFDPNLPSVSCYIGEFNQVILNLIVNAAHAIGDVVRHQLGVKGTITIQTRRVGDHVEIRITDTGAGIPESVRPRIFEPFFTTKQVGKGTGQGLAVVYSSVVKKHGGSIRFESEVNKGTIFFLTLPISPPTPTLSDDPDQKD